ncbi:MULTISPECIES: DUF4288 domain-containing protein [unclassified Flavobacterium]|jgi:hypothetical protein|uniref:DUF4288 domain-containing protein n=1 Tax=unclassified Flavobacterium TaxID=196869 RepID=UPI00064B6497|nr:DUF4288 domain-containing protein [Flavobacterium sp. ABG]KLT71377.1 hypothetical protein AB674_02560 [Flavobacterium sp. ABG]
MSANEKISNKKGNWYIAEIIEKREPFNNNKENDLRRVVTWGNFHLIKAESPKLAYEKAVKIGKDGEINFTNSDNVEMEYTFVGIADLIPIYEDNIEDGSELMWTNYGSISNRKSEKFVRTEEDILQNIKLKKD